MIVVSILTHVEFGPNDHRDSTPHYSENVLNKRAHFYFSSMVCLIETKFLTLAQLLKKPPWTLSLMMKFNNKKTLKLPTLTALFIP